MRILFLTNFFPPAARGGYELWCQEVAEGLQKRGHKVVILTSRYDRNKISKADPDWVHRDLHLEMDLSSSLNSIRFFINRKARERVNLTLLCQKIESFQPDCILIWGMWNLPRSLPALAEQLLPGRVVYYMGDYWPTLPSQFEFFWKSPPRHWTTSLPKRFLGNVALRKLAQESQPSLLLEHVLFPTVFLRDELRRQGITPKNTKIVCGAVDTSLYNSPNGSRVPQKGKTVSLLYAGRLTHEKGVHTAVEAMGKLVNQHGIKRLKLFIVGSGDSAYDTLLRSIVEREKIEPFVIFLGAKPKEAMPNIFHQADIFLFTSIWPEPFGRVIVEAMASGLAVVSTVTGGAAEIITENQNALTFPPDDSTELAKQIARLYNEPSLMQQVGKEGRRTAIEKFDIQAMVSEIERYLKLVNGHKNVISDPESLSQGDERMGL